MAYTNGAKGGGVGGKEGKINDLPTTLNETIYEGSVVVTVDGAATTALEVGGVFCGVADKDAVYPARTNVRTYGLHRFFGTGFTAANLNAIAYLDCAVDPLHVTVTKPTGSTNFVLEVGRIKEIISATEVYVQIDNYVDKSVIIAGV